MADALTHKLTLPSNGYTEQVTKEQGEAVQARYPRAGYLLESIQPDKPADLSPVPPRATPPAPARNTTTDTPTPPVA